MKKHNLIPLLCSIVLMLAVISCNDSWNPAGNINKSDLIGKWRLTKEIYKEIEEWFYEGENGKDEWVDTFYVNDTSEIIEIDESTFFIYDYYNNIYYTKLVLPYTLSGNAITGNDEFNGYVDEGGGSYEKWSTIIKSLSKDQAVIEYYGEYKEVDSSDWYLEKETLTMYFDKYSGNIPPDSWPDSVVVDTNNIVSDIVVDTNVVDTNVVIEGNIRSAKNWLRKKE